MERMTYRLEDQYGNPTDKIILESDYICMSTPKKLEVVLSRLAAYEETGLEPEAVEHLKLASMGKAVAEITEFEGIPIDRLKELAQADREGKFPKYTIGDTIYDRFGDAWEVRTAELHLIGKKLCWMYRCGHAGTADYCALWSCEILTHEEAEEALRREQNG